MTTNLRRDASFIVRIWWERPIDTGPVWRGQVVHARTGQARYFDHLEDLLCFVEQWTGVPQTEEGQEPIPAGQSLDHKEK